MAAMIMNCLLYYSHPIATPLNPLYLHSQPYTSRSRPNSPPPPPTPQNPHPLLHLPTRLKRVLLVAFSFRETLSARMTLIMLSMPAAATPIRARPKSSMAHAWAPAAKAATIIMMTMTDWRTACRPKMWASWPQTGMKEVEVMVKAVTIQLSCSIWSMKKCGQRIPEEDYF